MARKIESLRQDQLIDWKQAFREVRHIYKDFQNVKIQEQEEAGNLSKPLGYSHIIYIYIQCILLYRDMTPFRISVFVNRVQNFSIFKVYQKENLQKLGVWLNKFVTLELKTTKRLKISKTFSNLKQDQGFGVWVETPTQT